MKRLFTLITSIVLATSLLAVPCFAAEPEDLPAPQPGVTETEQPDGSDQPENPDRPSIQPCCGIRNRRLQNFRLILLLPFW